MASPSGPSHTANAPSGQFRGRDSRVVSIYDKYLYDPKDLESSDPRRRELARKASRMRLQGKAANVHEANGQNPPNRKSISFAQGTKAQDRTADQPAQGRDSGAWGLGLGMLGGNASDSDSDSEDGVRNNGVERRGPPAPAEPVVQQSERDSWSERAAAVGQRPPDSASQNPPSLKLMGLKSAKMGGAAIPPAPGSRQLDSSYGLSQDRQQKILSTSDYGDNTSRHGSTINFGARRESYDSSGPSPQLKPSQVSGAETQGSRPISPKTALTRQLGLISPLPPPAGAQQQTDYFSGAHGQQQPRSAGESANGPLLNPHSPAGPNPFQDDQSLSARSPMPMGPPHSPQYGPGGPGGISPPQQRMPSPGMVPPGSLPRGPPPQGSLPPPRMPPDVLQRGPPPSMNPQHGPPRQPMMSPSGGPVRYANGQGPAPFGPSGRGPPPGPGGPMATRGPSPAPPTMPGPSPGPGPMRGPPTPGSMGPPGPPGPPGSNGLYRGPPPAQQQPLPPRGTGPGFSDSPGPSKRQSIFRRSMAFFQGGPQGQGPRSGPPGQQGPPNGAGPGGKRRSLFRRSMAFLGGGGGGGSGGVAPRGQPAPIRADQPPRVKGFQDDSEKLDHNRKSEYLGGGADGFEWDAQGQGAKFWRRFSMAQRTASTDKIQAGSRAWHETMRMGKRRLIMLAVVSLLLLIGTIVGIIVWRETKSPSGSKSDDNMPGSTYRGNFGDGNAAIASDSVAVSGALDRRGPQPTGLAKRIAYPVDEAQDGETLDVRNASLLHRRSAAAEGVPRNLPRRHRRRRSDVHGQWKQRASLADID